MDAMKAFLVSMGEGEALWALVGEALATSGLSITHEDAVMLAKRRDEVLVETERVEFGAPVVAAIAEAIAASPCLSHESLVDVLASLQDVFYALRDELPVDVPDAEIIEALRGCFDACEGDVGELAVLPASEVMAFSREFIRAANAEASGEYRIADDEGRVYAFNPAEWDYDEQADGWDGERWSDDWDG